MRPRPFFQYGIGSFVQLASGAPMQRVIWRGKQLVPSMSTSYSQLYRLNNSTSDATV